MSCDCDDYNLSEYQQEQAYFEREMFDEYRTKLKQTLESIIQNAWDKYNNCLFCLEFIENSHKAGCIITNTQERLQELKRL